MLLMCACKKRVQLTQVEIERGLSQADANRTLAKPVACMEPVSLREQEGRRKGMCVNKGI